MKRLLLVFLLLASALKAQTVTTPGWHRIPGTAACGGGSQPNATFSDPDNFYGYGFNFASLCYARITDSNSGIMDTNRHRFIYWGGGHQIYWGNDVISLDLLQIGGTMSPMHHLDHSGNAANGGCPATGPVGTQTESNGAVCFFAGSSGTGPLGAVVAEAAPTATNCTAASLTFPCPPSQLSTPGSVHTYEGLVYVPPIYSGGNVFGDYMLVLGGISAPQGDTLSTAWTLSMNSVTTSCAISATNAIGCNPVWTPLGGSAGAFFWNPGTASAGQIADYDPTTQTVWIQTQSFLYQFNPVTSTITQKSSNGILSHFGGAFDPVHQYFIYAGDVAVAGKFQYVNTGSGVFTIITPTTTGCSGFVNYPTSTEYPGMAWDEIDHRMVIYPNQGNTLFILDPATWTCTTETYGATAGVDFPFGPDLSQTGTTGTFGHFRRDPALDLYILCGTATAATGGGDTHDADDCWYLRRRR